MQKEIDGLNINKQRETKWDKEGKLRERIRNSNNWAWTATLSKFHTIILNFFF